MANHTDDKKAVPAQPAKGPVPYMSPAIFEKFKFRPGDIVIDSSIRCGTNWTMMIVHQLLTQGDDSFKNLYLEVPWIEFLEYPNQDVQERVNRFNANPKRRAFKTHFAPPIVPFDRNVQYIVVARNSKDVVRSVVPFFRDHSEEFRALWGGYPVVCKSIDEAMNMLIDAEPMYHGFYRSLWELRHERNVFFIHFNDLLKDLPGSIRRIAQFLKIDIDEMRFPKILECCSFAWMKTNVDRINPNYEHVPVPVFKEHVGIVREGKAKGDEDFTPEQLECWQKIEEERFPDPAMRHWIQNGGTLPQ